MNTRFKYLLMLIVLALTGAKASAASLLIEDFTIEPGTTVTVPLLLDNPDKALAAFQLDLYMPQGLSVDAEGGIRLGERASSSHQLMTKVNGDHLTVMSFSFPATDFTGNSGAVAYIDVTAAADFEGQAIINVKNIALTTSDAHENAQPDFATTVTAQGFVVLGNEFYMNDFTIQPGKTLRVPVVMDNKASAVAGFQFDMYLPEGISTSASSFTLSDRKGAEHQVVANKNGDHWSVVAFGFPTADFTGDEGDIMYIDFVASKSFTGNATIEFRNIMLSTSDARDCPIEDFSVQVTADGVYTPTDRLSINDFSIKPGKKLAVPVLLDNELTAFSGFSFDIVMPEGLTTSGEVMELTARCNGHELDVEAFDNGFTIKVNDNSSKVFTGIDGAIMNIEVTASRDFEGQAIINVRNIKLVEPNADITTLDNFDVTVTADGIFEPENLFYINDFEITPGQTLQVPVIMDNEASEIAAFQLTLTMPQGLTATAQGVTLSDRKSSNHQVVANLNGNQLGIAAFSFPPTPFSGNEGVVMYISITASRDFSGTAVIGVSNVALTTADAVETAIDDFNVNVTANGVYVPSDNLTINDFSIAPGRSKQVPVVLTNETAVVNAVEFDLEIPQELVLSSQVRLGERASGHFVTTQQSGSMIHVVEAATPSAPFTGDDGNIMYLKVNASREFTGSTVINVKNVVLKTNGSDITIDDFAVVVNASGPYVPVDTLYIDDFSMEPGSTIAVPVIMDNEITNIAALQFDIELPFELSIPRSANGDYSMTLTSRMSDNHYIIANPKSDGTIRVVAVSFPPADFSGNSGAVLNIDMQAIEEFTGTTQFIVKNVVMTTANAQTEIAIPDFTVVVTSVKGSGHIIGDVNCDGEVTSGDITALYNYLLNGDETYIATSDVNGDGVITSVDVTLIYNILMGD